MAQFIGFKCDECSTVLSPEQRHKVTVKIDGPEITGEYARDLCEECVDNSWLPPEGVELRPLRRRRTKEEQEAEDAIEAAARQQADTSTLVAAAGL